MAEWKVCYLFIGMFVNFLNKFCFPDKCAYWHDNSYIVFIFVIKDTA